MNITADTPSAGSTNSPQANSGQAAVTTGVITARPSVLGAPRYSTLRPIHYAQWIVQYVLNVTPFSVKLQEV